MMLSVPTCLQCDWSWPGLGYILLQKYCSCTEEQAPVCCKSGWHLVYAGSRFTSPAESRYAPKEGEALAVAWSLHHSHMFTLGCPNLIVASDHKPLLGIFRDRDLGTIMNPRIMRFKEKTLRYRFKIVYCPGKLTLGADTMSRYPQNGIEE